jgi:sulfofructose kinase
VTAQVVCAGLATLDTIYRVPQLPPKDGRVVATERVVAGGGPAATAAVTLARLGVDVAFVGAVGSDEAGLEIVDGLEEEGVDVSAVAIVGGARSPQSTILVEADGARSIVHHPGSAAPGEWPGEPDWLHVDHVGYSARRGSAKLSIDAGNPIDSLDLGGVTLYAPTEAALERDFRGDPRAALAAGAQLVVVTRGAGGSVAYSDNETVEAPPFEIADVVSTLGAGDVFHGALLAALVRDEALVDALAFANRVAALSCRALDGRSAIPTLAEVA